MIVLQIKKLDKLIKRMTQILVAIPLMSISDRIYSPSIVRVNLQQGEKFSIKNPSIFTSREYLLDSICNQVTRVFKFQQQMHNSSTFVLIKRQLSEHNESNFHFLTLVENSTELEQLKNTLNNIKQDLSTYFYDSGNMMKSYSSLQKQNKSLLRKLREKQLSEESQQKVKRQEKQLSAQLNNLTEEKQKSPYEQHISLSLQLNSINASVKPKHLTTDPYQHNRIFITKLELKKTISSLEKQISDLTRQNLQLKNTIVYYEARLQFIAECLKKMQDQKEKEKIQNQNKKTKK